MMYEGLVLPMDYAAIVRRLGISGSDLDDLISARHFELRNFVSQAKFDRLLGREVDVLNSLGTQNFIGQGSSLAQDVFGALIVGESYNNG